MLTPSSMVSPMPMPSRAMTPAFRPVPIPVPMSFANPANFAFPVPFHHSRNGSAINSSHAIFALPKNPASCHSAVPEISLNFSCTLPALISSQSIKSFSPCLTAGICSLNQSASPLTYVDSLPPTESFTSSTALCRYVIEPCKLSIMVSAMAAAAPSALLIASARSL